MCDSFLRLNVDRRGEMTPVRIIGIGSSHGADRAGWLVTEALQQSDCRRVWLQERFHFPQCRFPAQLFQMVDGCELAILIDAVYAEPGTVIRDR